jgi:hypothetical protein
MEMRGTKARPRRRVEDKNQDMVEDKIRTWWTKGGSDIGWKILVTCNWV